MVIKNYTFEAEPVVLDFHEYRHCTFRKCRLVYCGYSAVTADNCRFEDCRWEFQGPALQTLHLLATLQKSGGEMGKSIVQQAMGVIIPPAEAGAGPAPTLPSVGPVPAGASEPGAPFSQAGA